MQFCNLNHSAYLLYFTEGKYFLNWAETIAVDNP